MVNQPKNQDSHCHPNRHFHSSYIQNLEVSDQHLYQQWFDWVFHQCHWDFHEKWRQILPVDHRELLPLDHHTRPGQDLLIWLKITQIFLRLSSHPVWSIVWTDAVEKMNKVKICDIPDNRGGGCTRGQGGNDPLNTNISKCSFWPEISWI